MPLEIEGARKTTGTLEAVLTSLTGEVTWSGIDTNIATLSSTTGTTVTVTPVAKGETTVTATCEEKSAEYTIVVTEIELVEVEPEIGDYVSYNKPYTDKYTTYGFTANDGWRYLGKDGNNHMLISTGIPLKLSYSYVDTSPPDWWDESKTEGVAYQAAAGLANTERFESITFSGGITGASFKDTSLGDKVVGVRTLTLPELNTARGESASSTKSTATKDGATGLFYLRGLGKYGYSESISPYYWLAYPTDSEKLRVVFNYGAFGSGNHNNYGVRPVVILSSEVLFTNSNGDELLEINWNV